MFFSSLCLFIFFALEAVNLFFFSFFSFFFSRSREGKCDSGCQCRGDGITFLSTIGKIVRKANKERSD